MLARVEYLNEPATISSDVEARVLHLKKLAAEAITLLPQAPAEIGNAVQAMESPSALVDLIASFMDVKSSDKQQLLETADLKVRFDRVTELLTHRIEVLRLQRQIEQNTREAIDERQKGSAAARTDAPDSKTVGRNRRFLGRASETGGID